MMKNLVLLALLVPIAACTQFAAREEKGVYTIREPFDPKDFAWSMNQGSASIAGRAVLKGSDGKLRSCAGNLVALTADNAYTREGAAAAKTHKYSRIERDPRYSQYRRVTTCDSTGRFAFRHLPHGNWGIGTRVEWEERGLEGRVVRGGPLGKTFRLSVGEKATVVLDEDDL